MSFRLAVYNLLRGSAQPGEVLTMGTDGHWAPGAAPTGGALGYAEVSFTFTDPLVSDVVPVPPTGGSLDVSLGDPGVTVGTTSIDYADQSLYIVNAFLQVAPGANVVNSDLHQFYYGYDPILGDAGAVVLNTLSAGHRQLSFTGIYALTGGAGTSAVQPTYECSGGTNREHDVDFLGFYITRFALPS